MLVAIPEPVWTPAYDASGGIRDGARVAKVTGLLDLSSWPNRLRVIVRKERPHPSAQLRVTDHDGHRITTFAINICSGGLGQRIRCAKTPTGHAARRWEPKRLSHRLITTAARLAATGRRRRPHLSPHAPWSQLVLSGLWAASKPWRSPADHLTIHSDEPFAAPPTVEASATPRRDEGRRRAPMLKITTTRGQHPPAPIHWLAVKGPSYRTDAYPHVSGDWTSMNFPAMKSHHKSTRPLSPQLKNRESCNWAN